MINKISKFFRRTVYVENTGVKYSELLPKFIWIFTDELSGFNSHSDMINFAIIAWNFGNMKLLLTAEQFQESLKQIAENEEDGQLMLDMIDYKVEEFSQYSKFIVDFSLTEKDAAPFLTVVTEEQESYLANISNKLS